MRQTSLPHECGKDIPTALLNVIQTVHSIHFESKKTHPFVCMYIYMHHKSSLVSLSLSRFFYIVVCSIHVLISRTISFFLYRYIYYRLVRFAPVWREQSTTCFHFVFEVYKFTSFFCSCFHRSFLLFSRGYNLLVRIWNKNSS